jgi:hypothetical protein
MMVSYAILCRSRALYGEWGSSYFAQDSRIYADDRKVIA